MKLLNPESVYIKDGEIGNSLYWNNEIGQCYYSDNNTIGYCDFTSSGISEEAKNKLAKVRWNIGTFVGNDKSKWTVSATYEAERSKYSGKNSCIHDCNDEVERTTTWDGYIGLMYPSDFGYAVGKSVRTTCLAKSMYYYSEDGCKEADWLTKSRSTWLWTLTPVSSSFSGVFNIYTGGSLDSGSSASSNYGVLPVVYLKSSTTITDALGTTKDPFVAS